MRPIKVEFQAFGPYVGREIVDFEAISEKGLFLICGKTGIGKTMILDAITFALYGKSSGHGRDNFEAMRCTNADYDKTTFVKFEFENNGEVYLFERRLERKRKNLTAAYNLMKKDEEGIWRTLLENAKERDLNNKALEIIGLEYEQFRQVIVLPQGQFEKLLTSNSDEKEKILTSIFGEEKWQVIAEQLYDEVVERRNSLKEKKDKIANSLKEEDCDSLSQLSLVISHKENELNSLDEEYKSANYDKETKALQEDLILAKRFGDLHKVEQRILDLKEKAGDRKAWEVQINNANRAEKVRLLIEAADNALRDLNSRKQAEAEARQLANNTKKAVEDSFAELQNHLENEQVIEDKKTLKIQYEGKKIDYEGIKAAEEELSQKKRAEKVALEEETKKKESLDSFAPKIVKLQGEYTKLNEEHANLLESYLAGITGEIAETLEDGKPCPVCGSTSHPHKAIKADNSVTKAIVDKKKSEAEEKYNALQNTIMGQENAKKEYDEKHHIYEEKHAEVITQQSKIDNIKHNLIEGIDSLEKLEATISNIVLEIENFVNTKSKLEEKNQVAINANTEANAKIDPASKETNNAKLQYDSAIKTVESGLKENSFESVEEAKSYLLDENQITAIQNLISEYDSNTKAANDSYKDIKMELAEKNEPNEDECNQKLSMISEAKSNYAKNRGILESEINRLKNKRQMLEAEGEGIEAKIREVEEDFAFAKKLRGDSGTGLQRYILGIMFSSVVAAANKMLEMVHGGRYRLFRSDERAQGTNKRGLELKVYDKNSEDHEGRFVSTLSGGEKFLASLALSIGMSTIAQKSGIKIEALFIDEGFGSLDEDSIGDAMSILNSIQEANGLVGIISHVQLLQDRIPTKLRVVETDRGSHIVQTIG